MSRPAHNSLNPHAPGAGEDAAGPQEQAVRRYSVALAERMPPGGRYLACDDEVLPRIFDHTEDRPAPELPSIFAVEEQLILAHLEIPDIQGAGALLRQLA